MTIPLEVKNLVKAAIPAAVIGGGLYAVGIRPEDGSQMIEKIFKRDGAILAGLTAGTAVNLGLMISSLRNLEGKTITGNYLASRTEDDGSLVFQITCVDKRREDKDGGAIPGGYGLFGAEPNSALTALLVQHFGQDTPIGNFATGYLLSKNILTAAYAHWSFLGEVMHIANVYPNDKIKIEVKNHWEGCGAEGFTSIPSWWLKFKAHQATLADLAALPNEVSGYIYTNGILSPAIKVLSRGRVSISAVLEHSDIVSQPVH